MSVSIMQMCLPKARTQKSLSLKTVLLYQLLNIVLDELHQWLINQISLRLSPPKPKRKLGNNRLFKQLFMFVKLYLYTIGLLILWCVERYIRLRYQVLLDIVIKNENHRSKHSR